MSKRNPGKMVELPDGRLGQVFNADCQKFIDGKVPVYTYDIVKQADLFNDKSDLSELKNLPTKKILCDPKELKVVGFFD